MLRYSYAHIHTGATITVDAESYAKQYAAFKDIVTSIFPEDEEYVDRWVYQGGAAIPEADDDRELWPLVTQH
jgi:hypothetical protein